MELHFYKFKEIILVILFLCLLQSFSFSTDEPVNAVSLPDIYSVAPDISNCKEGALKESEKMKILDYVNQIRALHGLKPVLYDYAGDDAAMKGTLVCAANAQINHQPPSSWQCYSDAARNGTENSNLHINYLPSENYPASETSITGWLIDDKSLSGLEAVGHRRAIINPWVKQISFGRCDGKPKVGTYPFVTTMAFKYMNNLNQTITDQSLEFVAYPYHSYPINLVNKAFYLSFSVIYDKVNWWNNSNVNYSQVSIEMTDESNNPITVHSIANDVVGWGGMPNCLVWKANGLQNYIRYNVKIKNLIVNGNKRDYEYWFKLEEGAGPGKPNPPTLISPSDNSKDVELNVNLTWNASSGADSYNLQVSTTLNFANLIIDEQNITSTSFQLNELNELTTYFWRVSAVNSSGTSDWSTVWRFSTKSMPLAEPTLLIPPDNEQNVSLKPTFRWSKVKNAISYDLQVASSPSFGGSQIWLERSNLPDTFFVTGSPLPANRQLYWRARSKNQTVTGNWSQPLTFKTTDGLGVEELSGKSERLLVGNFPNPFDNATNILLDLKNSGYVKIDLCDITGKIIDSIFKGFLLAGQHKIVYKNNYIPTGRYYCRLEFNGKIETLALEIVK